jgi:hypothetical protein
MVFIIQRADVLSNFSYEAFHFTKRLLLGQYSYHCCLHSYPTIHTGKTTPQPLHQLYQPAIFVIQQNVLKAAVKCPIAIFCWGSIAFIRNFYYIRCLNLQSFISASGMRSTHLKSWLWTSAVVALQGVATLLENTRCVYLRAY